MRIPGLLSATCNRFKHICAGLEKEAGSSLFDFDQVCCINFGDVERLNLEEALLMVLFGL